MHPVQAMTTALSPPTKTAGAPQRILLVDDEHNLRISLATTLAVEGYEVVEAKDGQEALDLLESQSIDLVLTDIRMPRRSGIELFHEVRRRWPTLPVVMMTAFANEHLIEDVLAAGVFTVVDKPFDMAPMLQLVASALANPLILVIDQVKDEAKAILDMLKSVGLRAAVAPDASTAVQLLKDNRVDACVLDLEMADGLLGAQQVEDRLRAIRVIAITGQDHEELLPQTGQFSSETCLRRPLVLAELVRSIARARQTSLKHNAARPTDSEEPPLADTIRQEMRHELSNRLLVIRAAAYYLERASQRTGLWQADPQVAEMFALIEDAVRNSVAYLDRGAPGQAQGKERAASEDPDHPGYAGMPPSSEQQSSFLSNVLIVDDTENNRHALQTVLEDLALHVDSASNMLQARELLANESSSYRLVVLDQHIGDGLGTELVPLIRAHQPEARILLLSGSASEEVLQQEGTKVDAYMAKGRDISELLAVIAELLT